MKFPGNGLFEMVKGEELWEMKAFDFHETERENTIWGIKFLDNASTFVLIFQAL